MSLRPRLQVRGYFLKLFLGHKNWTFTKLLPSFVWHQMHQRLAGRRDHKSASLNLSSTTFYMCRHKCASTLPRQWGQEMSFVWLFGFVIFPVHYSDIVQYSHCQSTHLTPPCSASRLLFSVFHFSSGFWLSLSSLWISTYSIWAAKWKRKPEHCVVFLNLTGVCVLFPFRGHLIDVDWCKLGATALENRSSLYLKHSGARCHFWDAPEFRSGTCKGMR